MKRYIFLLIIFLYINNNAFSQKNAPSFSAYVAALYLLQHHPILSTDKQDTVHFLIDEKWLQQVARFIKDVNVVGEKPKEYYPCQPFDTSSTKPLGIMLEFYNEQQIKDWLELPEIKKIIEAIGTESLILKNSYDGYRYQLSITSFRHIDWRLVWRQIEKIEQAFYAANPYEDYKPLSNSIRYTEENEIWEHYTSPPCANLCSSYHFNYHKTENLIIYGYSYDDMGAGGYSWNISYNLKTRKIEHSSKSYGNIAIPDIRE